MYQQLAKFGVPIEAKHVDPLLLQSTRVTVIKADKKFIAKYYAEINDKKIRIIEISNSVGWSYFASYIKSQVLYSYKYRKDKLHDLRTIKIMEKVNSSKTQFIQNKDLIEWPMIRPKILGMKFIEKHLLEMDPKEMGLILAQNPYFKAEIYEKYEHLIQWNCLSHYTKCPPYLLDKYYYKIVMYYTDYFCFKFSDEFYEQHYKWMISRYPDCAYKVLPFKIIKQLFEDNSIPEKYFSLVYRNEHIPLYFLKKLKIPRHIFICNPNIPVKFFKLNIPANIPDLVRYTRQNFLESSYLRIAILKTDF